MIGNDVVDLALAKVQSNWSRRGFLEKVFTSFERQEILSAQQPSLLVWLLWSMKEAGYKAHQRKFFLPRRLNWKSQECRVVQLTRSTATGSISIGKEQYFSRSTISADSIFTYASSTNNNNISLFHYLSPRRSANLKRIFLEQVSSHLNLLQGDLKIEKNAQGVPFLLHRGQPHPIPFSFTGHGRFSAFSYPLTNC